ncbi:MAG: glycosyltransferase [Candidatus Eisenbacteria bacterium]|nr:glycosyltransferase [Candidatus Eisenbacteria bacterium]
MRLLAYSHDTVGLGHLRRTLGICDDLVRSIPSVTALVVTGSPMAEGFRLPDRVDYVKLPSVRKLDNSVYASRSLDLDFERLSSLRSAVIRDTTRSFDPDLLLVDKTPAGLKGELLTTLEDLEARGARTRRVLGLRDVLDDPDGLRREWSREGLWEVIEEHYDAVWIYGDPEVFDTVREYAFPSAVAARSVYVGYLPRYNGLLPRGAVERELQLDGRRLIVVTAGGGEDGYPVFDHYLRELERVGGPAGALHCLVAGPGMPEEQRASLRTRAVRPDVFFTDFSSHMTSLFAAADVVVTMGGYNSVMEILSLRRRAVVVPRVVPRTEQLIRAERLAARGLVRLVHPDALPGGELLAVVAEELARAAAPLPAPLAFDGHHGIRRELERLVRTNGHVPLLEPGFEGRAHA